MIDLNALDRFALVVESGSFSAAARRLSVSRQAVQRSVDTLEEQHGVQLLERTTRSLRLTDAGRRLLVAATAVRAAGREADAVLTAATATPRGVLRITAPPLFGNAVLARAIPTFLARWPEVDIQARFLAGRTDPRHDDFDLTLRIGAAPPETAYAVRIGKAALVLCAAETWLRAHPAPTAPDQLLASPLLAYGFERGPWSFDGPDGLLSVDVHPRLRTDSADVALTACRAGLGILRIPEMAVAPDLAAGTLRRVLPAWTIPAADVWAVYGHRTAGDPTLAAFLDVLRTTPW